MLPSVGPFSNVPVKLHGLRRPRPANLAVLRAFITGFTAVEADIQRSLWAEYTAYHEAVEDGLVPSEEAVVLSGPDALWLHAKMIQIEVGPFKNPQELELGFTVDWDIDHTKGIGVEDGKVTYTNGSIRAWV